VSPCPATANPHRANAFRSHHHGRIAWAGALNPTRGDRLRAVFDVIDWTR
jgi:hypothetical protein